MIQDSQDNPILAVIKAGESIVSAFEALKPIVQTDSQRIAEFFTMLKKIGRAIDITEGWQDGPEISRKSDLHAARLQHG